MPRYSITTARGQALSIVSDAALTQPQIDAVNAAIDSARTRATLVTAMRRDNVNTITRIESVERVGP